MKNTLRRVAPTSHPWRFHKWQKVEGLVDTFTTIEQCSRCNLVRLRDLLLEETTFVDACRLHETG